MRNIEKFYKTYSCDQNGIFTLERDTILFKYEDDDALYHKGYYYLRHNSKVTDEKRFTLTNLSDFDVGSRFCHHECPARAIVQT